jgi:ABC-2 type transport system permease protein
MKQQLQAFQAEILKNKHSKITWITFIAFSLGPLFGGVFMFLMKDNGIDGLSGGFKAKAAMMQFDANWDSFLGLLAQVVGVGGIIIFGFVASWLFGREYSDKTAKDLVSLPISRAKIVNAKFIYYFFWCLALVISNLILGLIIGFSLKLPGWNISMFYEKISLYFITTLMIITLNTLIGFFAVYGKGYMAPLGIVVIVVVLAQIFAALGLGTYFPWAIPGIYSGSGGAEIKSQLNNLSYFILIFTGIVGYFTTIFYQKYSNQSK